MSKQVYLGLFLFLILSSCIKSKKNYDDYFPRIVLSATVQMDGSVLVHAEFIEAGAFNISYVGFAYGETSDFSIDQNQILFEYTGGNSFEATYPPGFDMTKTYYFKAWATNALGFGESNVVALVNIEAVPVDGPCSYTLGYLFVTGPSETVTSVSAWQTDVDFNSYIDVGAQYSNVKYTFDDIPYTGVYTTTQYAPEPGEVKISFMNTFGGFIQASVDAGQSVYVNRPTANSWNIEVCSSNWTYNSFTYTFDNYFAF